MIKADDAIKTSPCSHQSRCHRRCCWPRILSLAYLAATFSTVSLPVTPEWWCCPQASVTFMHSAHASTSAYLPLFAVMRFLDPLAGFRLWLDCHFLCIPDALVALIVLASNVHGPLVVSSSIRKQEAPRHRRRTLYHAGGPWIKSIKHEAIVQKLPEIRITDSCS